MIFSCLSDVVSLSFTFSAEVWYSYSQIWDSIFKENLVNVFSRWKED